MLILVGCAIEVIPIPTTTPTATITPLPKSTKTPSPTPNVVIAVQDIVLVPNADEQGWYVIGMLENQSQDQIESIHLSVSIKDQDQKLISEQVIQPFLLRLSPNESTPFKATFPRAEAPSSAQAVVIAHQPVSFPEVRLRVEELKTISTNDGGMAIFATLENRRGTSVVIEALGFLAVDAQGKPIELFPYTAGLSMIGPGAGVPILAHATHDPGEVDLVPYSNASFTRSEQPTPLSISSPPQVLFTEQGAPLILGTLTNESDRPIDTVFLVVLRLEGEIVSLASIKTTIPLRPGESRPYAITDFPGLTMQIAQHETGEADLMAEIVIDHFASQPSDRKLVQLDLQITQFEPIGSSIFIKGTITNPHVIDVGSATVLAAARTTDGELITAGSTSISGTLTSNDVRDFVLNLTLPQGADSSMSEYDIQALGLLP
jgi:hypothetical protein